MFNGDKTLEEQYQEEMQSWGFEPDSDMSDEEMLDALNELGVEVEE